MIPGIVPTPLGAAFTAPVPRAGGFPAALLEALVPAPGTEAALAALRAPDVLVVTTGQQPALFTGPLYTVHKALSAAALARQLSARWGRPVVPVFWSAGDDHDFAEANHASWPAADGTVRTVTLRERAADAPLVPLWREPLGAEVTAALETLAADLPPAEFREPTLAWLGRHFRPEATVAAADRGALAELLAPAGVVVLDCTHAAAKRAMAPWLLRALDAAAALDAELGALGRSLEQAGHAPSVTVGDGATLVMVEGRLGRDRLVREGEGFVTRRSREPFTRQALAELAAADPQRLSPNVLLRPVVESALLPTVAYVAGPGELRYLELVPPVYARLGVLRQQPVPRWSGVLLEPKVQRVLDKFGIPLAELLEPAGALEARLVRGALPEATLEALQRLREAIEREFAVVAATADQIDPTLAKPVQGARQTATNATLEAEKKLLQHLKKRQETELAQIGRARDAVFPLGKPQERVLTVAPFLSRNGPGLVTSLLAVLEAWYAAQLEARPATA